MTDNDLSTNLEEIELPTEDDTVENQLDPVINEQVEDLLAGINGNPESREVIKKN